MFKESRAIVLLHDSSPNTVKCTFVFPPSLLGLKSLFPCLSVFPSILNKCETATKIKETKPKQNSRRKYVQIACLINGVSRVDRVLKTQEEVIQLNRRWAKELMSHFQVSHTGGKLAHEEIKNIIRP